MGLSHNKHQPDLSTVMGKSFIGEQGVSLSTHHTAGYPPFLPLKPFSNGDLHKATRLVVCGILWWSAADCRGTSVSVHSGSERLVDKFQAVYLSYVI